jgi:hypothetical protein
MAMREPSRKEDEPRALALAAFNLTKALMNALETKGVLDAGEVQGVLDETLTSLEHRVQDGPTDLARRIVESIVVMRAVQRPGPEGADG